MSAAADKWTMGGGATVLLIVTIPLWRSLSEPGLTVWNVILALLMIGFLVAVFFLQRFFHANIGNIGEARFDTRNGGEPND